LLVNKHTNFTTALYYRRFGTSNVIGHVGVGRWMLRPHHASATSFLFDVGWISR